MANVAPSELIYEKGDIIAAPTNLAAAYPYGGTVLGSTRMILWQPAVRVGRVKDEGFAGKVVRVYRFEETAILRAFLRGWDKDAINRLPGGGITSGRGTRSYNAADNRPAALTEVDILFASRNTTSGHHIYLPGAVIYELGSPSAINLRTPGGYGTPVVIEGLNGFQEGQLQDITLV